jgi:hypothetical protein
MDIKKKSTPALAGVKKEFGHDLSDRCQNCALEFGDHRAKPPHPAYSGTSPAYGGTRPLPKLLCRGFRALGVTEAAADQAARYAIS